MTGYDEAYNESVRTCALAYADEVGEDPVICAAGVDIQSPLLASIAADLGDIQACVAHTLELPDDEDAGLYALAAEANGSIEDTMEAFLADVAAEAEDIMVRRMSTYRFADEVGAWGGAEAEYVLV